MIILSFQKDHIESYNENQLEGTENLEKKKKWIEIQTLPLIRCITVDKPRLINNNDNNSSQQL